MPSCGGWSGPRRGALDPPQGSPCALDRIQRQEPGLLTGAPRLKLAVTLLLSVDEMSVKLYGKRRRGKRGLGLKRLPSFYRKLLQLRGNYQRKSARFQEALRRQEQLKLHEEL